MEKTQKIKIYLALHLLLAVFSLSPVCSKLAGQQPLFSFEFFLYYGLCLLILGVYAIAWQQIIKRLPLTAAYANKAITVVWGMLWGLALFSEKISLQKVVGAGVIIAGIVLFALACAKEEAGNEQ